MVGGLSGAYRKYELDYWNLAFREAQEYINQTASQGSNIYVVQSKYLAQTFARPDLIYNAFGGQKKDKYDYIIVSTAGNEDKKYTRFRTVYTVERFGVPLAYVKKP